MSWLTGQLALVTGAASGIGAALSTELERQGARVVRTDIEGDVDHRLDVREPGALAAAVERYGLPDLLFVNAGIALGGPTHEFTAAHWDRIIDINLRGAVNALLEVYPGMVARRSGQIVVTASGAGLVAPPFVVPYATTKHALVGLATGLRPEAALHGVKVNVVCPGAVETPILDRLPDRDLPATATPPVTARRYLAVVGQRPVGADQVASSVLKGVRRNRAIIVTPWSARPLWYVARLSPGLAGGLTTMVARRVDKRLVRPKS